jgi:arylsulfatase A-like enzyme
MIKSPLLISAGILVQFLTTVAARCEDAPGENSELQRPNVILIMTDDQGYGDLGCHGNTMIRTPHLDQLYKESIRLTDFHVDPTCSPTRAALLTGRYSTSTGVWHTVMGRSLLYHDEVTMADVFSSNGYRTGIFGKWHLGDNFPMRPQDRGFHHTVVHGGGGIGQTPDYWGNTYIDDYYEVDGSWTKFTGYCTDVFFNETIDFINQADDRPFFVYLPTNVPHSPFVVPAKYKRHYLSAGVSEPMASFYGMIENFDENVGRLLQWLKETDRERNTVVIFMTDNGTAAGIKQGGAARSTAGDRRSAATGWTGFNAGMRGAKGSPYEGGHRVPCFVRWPDGGIGGGSDVAALAAHFDLLPTLIELCGLEFSPKHPFDGRSLVPLLQNAAATWPERTLFVHTQREEIPPKWKASSVMQGKWRLVDGGELYDLQSDPGQQRDLAAQQPELVRQLRQDYDACWLSLQPAFSRFAYIVLGSEHANPVTLTCMDWHAPTVREIPWNQPQIVEMPAVNGWWMVDVAKPGRYAITLRHKPAVAEFPLQAVAARVKLGEVEALTNIASGSTSVTLQVDLPAGPARLETELRDDGGEGRGAYFVEILYDPVAH